MRLFLLQLRVIATLVLRETRMTFGTSQVGYLWAVLQPAATVTVMVVLFSLIGRQPPFGSSLALFFATAILTLEMYNKFSVSLMRGFTSNKALLTYPMIRETDTLVARAVLIISIFSIIYLLFYGVLVGAGYAPLPAHPERILAAFAATAFLGFGIGTINAVIYVHTNSWQHVEKLFARPLFFLSGVFYIPSHLPPQAIAVIKWNPLLHLVEWTRMGYYPNYFSEVLNIYYPLGVALTCTVVGLAAERFTRKTRM